MNKYGFKEIDEDYYQINVGKVEVKLRNYGTRRTTRFIDGVEKELDIRSDLEKMQEMLDQMKAFVDQVIEAGEDTEEGKDLTMKFMEIRAQRTDLEGQLEIRVWEAQERIIREFYGDLAEKLIDELDDMDKSKAGELASILVRPEHHYANVKASEIAEESDLPKDSAKTSSSPTKAKRQKAQSQEED